jgi:hypothetical protein
MPSRSTTCSPLRECSSRARASRLARRIRQAGTAIARSVAAAHLAPGPVTGGHAMRHRLRACEQALDLVELLQQGIDAGYFLPDIRQEAQRLACRLVILVLGCSKPVAEPPAPGRGASLAAARDCHQASPLPPHARARCRTRRRGWRIQAAIAPRRRQAAPHWRLAGTFGR